MNSKNCESVDDHVSRALEEYAVAMESGQPISREILLEKYADVADELAGCLDSLIFIRSVAPQLEVQCGGAESDQHRRQHHPVALGDYLIIREIGRGGMGVVYEAEQMSLGRSVALKVLPYAAMMDKKAIARFKNEARAAATLDHPHIVPVYAVGNERGIYYYAMSLINGLTLAELIRHFRASLGDIQLLTAPLSINDVVGRDLTPGDECSASHLDPTIDSVRPTRDDRGEPTNPAEETYRDVEAAVSTHQCRFDRRFFHSVAKLGAQAAEALEHAHQHGIVHRDIKPGNLMIDVDSKLWITDFGLARIESDAGVTMTGDLIGTLRYMAPEQALARRVVVDHRADIYALGATLYELMALRPVFDGNSRESLLKQITFEEAKSLRILNPRVPHDLHVIIHQSLAKDPDERYQSAQEMADDLRAFIDGEPIKAKPISAVQQVVRWAGKRKGLVATVTAVLLVAVLGLSISNALIAHERNVARDERNESDRLRKKAEAQRKLADANAKAARETVDTFYTIVSEDRLLNEPAMQSLRKELLLRALKFYQVNVDQRKGDRSRIADLADAYSRVASIHFELGSLVDALQAHRERVALQKELATAKRTDPSLQHDLASATAAVALVLDNLGKSEEAFAAFQESIEVRQRLLAEYPEFHNNRMSLGKTYDSLSRIASLSASKRMEFRRHGIAILESLVRDSPESEEYRFSLAFVRANGQSFPKAFMDETLQAEVMNDRQRAIAELEVLVEQNATELVYQEVLGIALGNIAGSYFELNQDGEGFNAIERAIDVFDQLVRENPAVPKYQYNLAIWYRTLALVHKQRNDLDSFREFMQKSIDLQETLLERYPKSGDYRQLMMETYPVAASVSQGEEAQRLFEKSARLISRIPEADRTIQDWGFLSQMLYGMNRYAEARVALQKNLALRGETEPTTHHGPRWWLMAVLMARNGETQKARDYYDRLVEDLESRSYPALPQENRLREELADLLKE